MGRFSTTLPIAAASGLSLFSTTPRVERFQYPRRSGQRLPHAPRLHHRLVWMAGRSDAARTGWSWVSLWRQTAEKRSLASSHGNRRGRKRNQIPAAQRRRSRQELPKRRRATSPKLCSRYGKNLTDTIPIPTSEWEFASCVKDSRTGKETIKPSSKELYLRSGFKPGHITSSSIRQRIH